ncbi:MAG: dihydrodipicolinate synthase family protein [Gammaproteobacteria bacterium]|nr:dihydrodipicolinate synthase family protein [Gammaproteobacteria bacterium]NKB61114.1 dihydrodipicolinate synthase family protein [Gammaproteobacteria bacterium]
MKFEGIYPPVITPHSEGGSIDRDGFVAMVEHLVESGVHGVIVGGTTGEYYAQTKEERVELMKLANETLRGRLPLIVGVGAIRTEDCIEYGQLAKENGAEAILLSAPYYAVPTQLELANHALAVDRAVNLPIMLYNYPGRTGTTMQAEFFDRVGRSPNFRGIKESTGDVNQLHMLAREYPHITLLCGMDDQALEFFAWGARGWVCAGGNCLPKEHVALYEAVALENDIVKGRRIMSALMPFMGILEQSGKFIQSIKHACRIEGLPTGPVRKPLQELNKQDKRELETVLKTLKSAMRKIQSESPGKQSNIEEQPQIQQSKNTHGDQNVVTINP